MWASLPNRGTGRTSCRITRSSCYGFCFGDWGSVEGVLSTRAIFRKLGDWRLRPRVGNLGPVTVRVDGVEVVRVDGVEVSGLGA